MNVVILVAVNHIEKKIKNFVEREKNINNQRLWFLKKLIFFLINAFHGFSGETTPNSKCPFVCNKAFIALKIIISQLSSGQIFITIEHLIYKSLSFSYIKLDLYEMYGIFLPALDLNV